MKIVRLTYSKTLAGCALPAIALWVILAVLPPSEPRWKGLRLSEWLAEQDDNMRFDPGDYRHSKFSDEEIAQALGGIGPAALPFLRQWLTAKPSRLTPRLNQWLNHQAWIRFRFGDDLHLYLQSLAETGFQVYGTNAQPLLPELIKLSHSRDPDTRLAAYEVAFFVRPDRDVFLPLAGRALNENDRGIQEMAAQCMLERFPDQAELLGLAARFPELVPKATPIP